MRCDNLGGSVHVEAWPAACRAVLCSAQNVATRPCMRPGELQAGWWGYPAIQNNLAQCYAGARVPLLAARSEIKTQTAKGYKASGRARPRNISPAQSRACTLSEGCPLWAVSWARGRSLQLPKMAIIGGMLASGRPQAICRRSSRR